MRSFLVTLALAVGLCGITFGQGKVMVHGRVLDRDGLGVAQASVIVHSGAEMRSAISGPAGEFSVDLGTGSDAVDLTATSDRMSSAEVRVPRANLAEEIVLTLHPSAVDQQVNVVATRSGIEMGPAARTVTSLSAEELQQYPALTLDESLRQHAGFELFRRSSGWVQNPTSQGISLRGLGSTAASRTLVLADGAPLSDAFGGWIHWNEIPPEAIDAVTLAAGGGSDLYGSSALGGVIDVIPARPLSNLGELSVSGAGEDTASASGRGDLRQSKWGELVAGQYFRTNGYTLIAPQFRGPVDIPANVHFENGRIDLERQLNAHGRAFVVGNVLNEARNNGTPLQTNATRLWRYLAGDDWTALNDKLSGRIRLFGSDQGYRQSFSSIGAARATESLTTLQRVGSQELGGSADTSLHLRHIAFVAGADARDIRATDLETRITANKPSGAQDTTARQRFVGGFGEVLGEHGGWSGTLSLRADHAQNLSSSIATLSATTTTVNAIPNRNEIVLSPRIGVVRTLGKQVNLHASAYRAFRTPTMNELYRTGQVGQQTTLANSALVSERATGAESGIEWKAPRTALDATYFWTEINRPVSAILIRSTATTVTNLRENLGQIQSQGLELAARVNDGHALSANFGYQYAHAVVTDFSAQTSLVGKWIPDVPRQSATAQIRAENHRFGTVTLAMRNSGRAFDDSSNTFILHSFFTMDLYAERSFIQRWTLFFSAQNLLDRSIDVARTPVLTLGTPFTAQGGVRFQWGATEKK